VIYLDFETRSEVDLEEVGAWNYSRHPSTEIICMAWKADSSPTQLWTPNSAPGWHCDAPGEGITLILMDRPPLMAHNAWFEQCIYSHIMVPRCYFTPLDPSSWYCSAAWAATYALPRSLEGAAQALGLSAQKDMGGHNLMMKMCKPTKQWRETGEGPKWHETKEDLNRLYKYCIQDVDTEYALAQKLTAMSRRVEGIK
jgi:DNA polymerase